jgi:hypothetical protein
MEQRFAAKNIQVADVAAVEDIERARKLIDVDPAQFSCLLLVYGKVAEVAGCVAGIGNRDVANGGAAATQEAN